MAGGRWPVVALGISIALGCSVRSTDVNEEHTSEPAAEGTGGPGLDLPVGDGDGDGDEDSSTGDEDGEDASGPPPQFFDIEDGGLELFDACDPWDSACEPGLKCQPLANTVGLPYDLAACLPFGTAAIGESCCRAGDPGCELEEPDNADTCGPDSFCLDVDPETHVGTCTEMCTGTPRRPICTHAVDRCLQSNQLGVCLETCDPLDPIACAEDELCVGRFGVGGVVLFFSCFDLGVEPPGATGEACQCANCCEPGLMCRDAATVGPGCAHDFCCTQLCDLGATDPGCTLPLQSCTPLFVNDDPLYAHVGVCRVPE